MTEQELEDWKVLEHCENPNYVTCKIPAHTIEELLNGE